MNNKYVHNRGYRDLLHSGLDPVSLENVLLYTTVRSVTKNKTVGDVTRMIVPFKVQHHFRYHHPDTLLGILNIQNISFPTSQRHRSSDDNRSVQLYRFCTMLSIGSPTLIFILRIDVLIAVSTFFFRRCDWRLSKICITIAGQNSAPAFKTGCTVTNRAEQQHPPFAPFHLGSISSTFHLSFLVPLCQLLSPRAPIPFGNIDKIT